VICSLSRLNYNASKKIIFQGGKIVSSPNLDQNYNVRNWKVVFKNISIVSVTFLVNIVCLGSSLYFLNFIGVDLDLTAKDASIIIGGLGSILTVINLSTIALMLEKQSRGVDESVNEGINRVSTLEGSLKGLPEKVEGIQNTLSLGTESVVVQLKNLQTSVSGLETSINGEKGVIPRLGTLETSVSGLETSVSGLETSVSGLETSVSGLETSINGERGVIPRLSNVETMLEQILQNTSKENN
jgi:exonuclease VII small subunit